MGLLLRAEELKGLISIEEAITAVEGGFRDQGANPQFSLPRQRMMAGDRRINIHSGGCVDLKVAGTFIHYERHRYTQEDQSYAAAGKRVYMAYDSETAALLTIIVGSIPLYDFDNNDIATETAITSAVGTKHLARQNCQTLGLYGTGRQARRHLKVMCALRPLKTVKVFSRSPQNRNAFCALMQPHVDAELIAVDDPRFVAEDSDLIVCATGSNVPVLFGDWLKPGVHITSIVGSNKELLAEGLVSKPRRELDDKVLAKADVIVATLKQQGIQDEQGDFIEPIRNGVVKWDDVRELADLVSGKVSGRTSESQISLFKQNSDQGVGFMALARLAHDKARKAGIGIEI
ncbi:MAG TPA: ornithine cyclodeaminase family protein [Candidatus Acidoferrales bacterium]|nr:ornithine cyclodeaminase family protein [Candidatus Acidoferrales bacterium]